MAMAPHSSTLAWKIPWTKEPGGLQSMGSLRVRHDWVTSLSLSCIGEGNGNPLQCSSLENPRDRGAWCAAVYGVAQSRTRLKWQQQQAATKSTYFILFFWTFYSVLGYRRLTVFDSFRWTVKGLSHTYSCIHSPPKPPSHTGHHITLRRVSCAIQ